MRASRMAGWSAADASAPTEHAAPSPRTLRGRAARALLLLGAASGFIVGQVTGHPAAPVAVRTASPAHGALGTPTLVPSFPTVRPLPARAAPAPTFTVVPVKQPQGEDKQQGNGNGHGKGHDQGNEHGNDAEDHRGGQKDVSGGTSGHDNVQHGSGGDSSHGKGKK